MKKTFNNILIFTVIFILTLTACSNNQQPNGETETIKPIGQIVITGSPTLGQIITQLTVEFTEENISWNNVDSSFPTEEINIVVNGGGSGPGISATIDGTANLGLVSRNVSDEEQAEFKIFKQYSLGTDALTISVNPNNKILEIQEDLSTTDLQKIFSGKYKYWDDIDIALPHEEIVLVTRDISGGAHEVFQQKIMGEKLVSPQAIQAPSMGALATKIIENKNAIGYASYGVVNQNKGKIIPLLVDGIKPSKENILNGKYKISRPILIISNGTLSPQEKALIDFLTSKRGMEVIEERGFVPNS